MSNCDELDKRTNAYKECIEAQNFVEEATENGVTNEDLSQAEVEDLTEGDEVTQAMLEEKHKEATTVGLGDIVEKVTKATGIKKVVDMFTPEGEDCGCDKRKKALNKTRLKNKTILCLNVDEYKYLDKLFKKPSWTRSDIEPMIKIEERVRNRRYVESLKCGKCIDQIYRDLKVIFSTYTD